MVHKSEQSKLIALRAQIDKIDRELLECLAQRDQCIENLVPLKNTDAVLDTPREQVVVESRSRWATEVELDRDFAAQFFALVMQHRAEQLKVLKPNSETRDGKKPKTTNSKPLLYSCSGCSNLAQLANQVAVTLDRSGVAEMSCIAGVGGGVATLVEKAKNAERIIAVDGCALHCVKHCLAQHGLHATQHYTLTEMGLKKRQHKDFEDEEFELVKNRILAEL